LFNLVLLTAALLVALEQPQLRRTHRLQRQLKVTLFGGPQKYWQGQTLDISESGARILLAQWPDLADIVDIEVEGDYGRRVVVSAEVIRVEPINDHEIMVTVNFVNVSQTQLDDLVLVLYSDVDEWYAQARQDLDNPLASLKFFMTALLRAFRSPQPAERMPVSKSISAAAQLYCSGHFYTGIAHTINSRTIQIQVEALPLQELKLMQQSNLPIGILLSQTLDDPNPHRLLAMLSRIEPANPQRSIPERQHINLELTFPKPLDQTQGDKIRDLLQALN
jgi:cellulose synthase (UDP-forming)